MLNGLEYKKIPSCSEPSIVLTVILTRKNEVLQIIQTSSCLFYKWTISLLSIFTSFPSDESDYELQGSPAIFDISPIIKIFLSWKFAGGSDILLIIWPYHHTNSTPLHHHTSPPLLLRCVRLGSPSSPLVCSSVRGVKAFLDRASDSHR